MFRTSVVHLQERSYAVCCNLVCLDTSCFMRVKEAISDFNNPSSEAFLCCMLQFGMSRYVLLLWGWRKNCSDVSRHTKFATYSLKTLLKMDYCGPKHVGPPNVMNKLNHKTLCILLDFIYIARLIHDPYNIKLNMTDLWIIFRLKRISVLFAMFKPDVHFDIPYGSPATEFFYHLFIKAELKIMFSFHNILHNVYNRPVISFT